MAVSRAVGDRPWVEKVESVYATVAATKKSERFKDIGLLVARVGLAWIFIYHGAGTLFGAFHGAGLHRASIFYGTIAHLHPGLFFAVLGGIIECFGGAAVGVGIFGRLAAAGLAGDMAMAMITVTFNNGISSTAIGGGYELNLALAALAFVVAVLGTGELSLDRVLRDMLHRSSQADRVVSGTAVRRPI